jgi:hypothetical protein
MNNIKPLEIPSGRFPVDATSSMPVQYRGSSSDIQKPYISPNPPREAPQPVQPNRQKMPGRP